MPRWYYWQFFSAYFQGKVVGGAEGSRLWGIAVGIAMLVVAVTAPILGTIADFSGKKKTILLFMTGTAIFFCGMLFFVQKGDVWLGMIFFILAEIGYRGGQVFYNSLLPEIATQDELSVVSGKGWAIGSLGGIVCLLIVLALIMTIGGTFIIRISFIITAVFFAASAAPLFLIYEEKAKPQPLPEGENYLTIAYKRLRHTFKSVRNYREFLKFMVAFLIYNDGILAALDFAAILGAVLFGMNQQQLIIFMIIVQVTSVIGAYVYGVLGEKFGFKNGLIQSLLLMILAVAAIYFNTTLTGFFIIGAVAGFALTAVQSLSRTMISAFAPPGQSAEFFGFFAVAGRTSSFIGPTLFGIIAAEATQWYVSSGLSQIAAEQAGHRISVWSIVIFLLVGVGSLVIVNEKEGRKVAQQKTVAEMVD